PGNLQLREGRHEHIHGRQGPPQAGRPDDQAAALQTDELRGRLMPSLVLSVVPPEGRGDEIGPGQESQFLVGYRPTVGGVVDRERLRSQGGADMAEHKIGTREEWQVARDELAKLEGEQAERNEELKRRRR